MNNKVTLRDEAGELTPVMAVNVTTRKTLNAGEIVDTVISKWVEVDTHEDVPSEYWKVLDTAKVGQKIQLHDHHEGYFVESCE